MLSRLLGRRDSSNLTRKRGRRLELVFYRGEAKAISLQRIFGVRSADALWAGLYLHGTPLDTLNMNLEALEALTPPYASISFSLPTSDPGEHLAAKTALEAAGIHCDQRIDSGPAGMTGGRSYLLTGSTLNRDIYQMVLEEIYGPPTLYANRFLFTISPPLVNPEVDFLSRRSLVRGLKAGCVVSTYFWRGFQLVSRELTEETVERLGWMLAEKRQIAFEVRNRLGAG